jgi:ArsR family transcriptional regulator, arsenate/arsenite/antimonite-responsive transcriptional repressor
MTSVEIHRRPARPLCSVFSRTNIVKTLTQPAPNRALSNSSDPGDRRQLEVSDDLVDNLVKLFKLLSDETRLRILYYLTQRNELHVRALCELLGESQPAVSHHLALLRVAGLIERRREGKHNFYGLKTRQFSTLLDMLFEAMPEGSRRIRFEDYMLTHVPD